MQKPPIHNACFLNTSMRLNIRSGSAFNRRIFFYKQLRIEYFPQEIFSTKTILIKTKKSKYFLNRTITRIYVKKPDNNECIDCSTSLTEKS